jgi:hypothetical protein
VIAQASASVIGKVKRLRDHIAYQLDPKVDRHVLEAGVFPALEKQDDVRRILFVGCDWYTKSYPSRFAHKAFRTIDIDPSKARYGSRDHIVGSVLDLAELVGPGTQDAIVCSGVIGFGVHRRQDAERMFASCYDALRPGGWLVLGWNDVADLTPYDLAELEQLARFEPDILPPFLGFRYPTFSPAKHTFDFYRRPQTTAPRPEAQETQ